jgi:predicted nucleotide-binding protein
VICEISLFMGALGRERALMLQPRGSKLKLPSDFLGLTPIMYETGPVEDLPVLLGPACNEMRNVIRRLGCR